MKINPGEAISTGVRLLAFVVCLAPFAALFLPWVTLDGTDYAHTGVSSITQLASPLRDYMFDANPVQALIVTVGPAVIILLTIITGSRYCSRRSLYWAPPLMLAMVLAIVYLTEDLVSATHEGLDAVGVVAILLTVHQLAITHLCRDATKPALCAVDQSPGNRNRCERVMSLAMET